MNHSEQQKDCILYVDDEELACKYFQRSAGSDYQVLTVMNANDAIKLLEQKSNRIGVIVTDFRMPGRDGGDLLRQIEREYPILVRILVTAYADKALLLATVNSSEVFRILEKPVDMTAVRQTLRLAVGMARERLANRQRLAAINETLAFLAHELNTPLATIINYARGIEQRAHASHAENQLLQSQNGPAIRQAVQAMHDNARYCLATLAAFIDSVRNAGMSLSSNGSLASQLLDTLLDTYPMSVDQRDAIILDTQQDFRISALPNCVALVLSSLITNALRALQTRPTPKLKISIRVSEQGDQEIELVDNGPGIPPHVLEHLLVDPITTHAEAGGSGRGMIFCNRIMQAFGGGMKIESQHGSSTIVTLRFPNAKNAILRSA